MKFTSATFLGVAALAAIATVSVDAVRGGDFEGIKNKERKLPSGSGDEGACPTCEEKLPGYSFFGENYLDGDFWKDWEEYTEDCDAEDYPSGWPTAAEAEYGVDYLIPGRLGFSTNGITCYESCESVQLCGFIAKIAELLYKNDLLRCLLTSLATTLRNFGCASIGARRRLLNGEQNESLNRFLAPASGDAPVDYGTILMEGLPALNITSMDQLVVLLGIEDEFVLGGDGSAGIRGLKSKKSGSQDDIGAGLDALFEELGYGDPNVEQSFPANIFINRCLDSTSGDETLCFGIFGLLKALDASVCYYREELGCGEKTCTKDLAFDVNYAAERLAVDFGVIDGIGPPALLIADILAPCGACIIEKSAGCSAFCPLYESYHTCDPVQTIFFESQIPHIHSAPMIAEPAAPAVQVNLLDLMGGAN